MLAVHEPSRVYLEQPNGTRVQRQITRMIRHLRDQYHARYPTYSIPSNWLLEELVINGAKNFIIEKDSWQERVRLTLRQIIRDTSYDDCMYINSRTNLPLFPNNELFDAWEVHQVMKAMLHYLDEE